MKTIFYTSLIIQFILIILPPRETSYSKFYSLGIERFDAGHYSKAINNFTAAKISKNITDEQKKEINNMIIISNTCDSLLQRAEYEYENENFFDAKFYYEKILYYNPTDEKCKKKVKFCKLKHNVYENMIGIEGGKFIMGTKYQSHKLDNEEHVVSISKFYMDKYEVTNREYLKFLSRVSLKVVHKYIDYSDENSKIKYTGLYFFIESGFEDYPVVEVSWYGADAYAKSLGKRLPTEAEWEFAARGGNLNNNYIYSGSNDFEEVANCKSENRENANCYSVGTKKPNQLGLFDMSGNVWEWCDDWYFKSFYVLSPFLNPRVENDSDSKVLRGGGYTSTSEKNQVFFRNFDAPDAKHKTYGFRCVKN